MAELCPKTIILLRCGGCQASVAWDALQAKRLLKLDDGQHVLNHSCNPQEMPRTIVWDDSDEDVCHGNLMSLERVRSSAELAAIIHSAVGNTTKNGLLNEINTREVDATISRDDQCMVLVVQVYVCHGNPTVRKGLVNSLKSFFKPFESIGVSLVFPVVTHPTAFISSSAKLGQGCFVGPVAVVHTNSTVGDFCIINTHGVVEHDCYIEEFCNVNPGAIVCGVVQVMSESTIGANATVRDHTSIALGSVVGMQAGVVSSICKPGEVHIGTPSKVKYQENIPIPRQLSTGSKENSYASHLENQGGEGEEIFSNAVESNANAKLTWCLVKKFNYKRFHNYLLPSLMKGHLTNDGPLQRRVTEKIKEFCGSKKTVLMTTNGTSALHVLATAWEMKLSKRLRWATQAFTFPSSIQGPLCDAVVLDMDEELLGPSLLQLQELKDSIDGVIVTNIFSQVCDCVAYENWCKENGKILLLDNAATAVHFASDGRSIHDIGDGAFVSLHETKPLGRGEGGALFVTPCLHLYAHRAMNFGFNIYSSERIPHRFASNWRMSDFAAAALCDHIDHVKDKNWVGKHEELMKFTIQEISSKCPGMRLYNDIRFPALLSCLFLTFPSASCDFDLVATYLHRCNPSIEAKRYYRPLSSQEEAPVAWNLFQKSICLPFHIGLTQKLMSYQLQELFYAVTVVFA
jgi:dTDP-4-amino-4,6-dideoxygalactose transaminase/carbonic anhydrase/acetyltransferase-like protein (isoleucine patch superfamily)